MRILSKRISISQRTLFRYIDSQWEMGYPISYCLRRGTYYLIDDEENKKQIII
jgi:predicted DNA-binding transcriptional regulator YafY